MDSLTNSRKLLLRGLSLGLYLLLFMWLADQAANRYISVVILSIGILIATIVSVAVHTRDRLWVVDVFTLLFSLYAVDVIALALTWAGVGYSPLIALVQLIAIVLLLAATHRALEVWPIKYWLRIAIVGIVFIFWALLCSYFVRLLTTLLFASGHF